MADALDKYRQSHFLGSGWSFPVTFSKGNSQLDTTEYEHNINESIQLVLGTKKMSRPLQPQFGSGLQEFFFNKMDETLKGQIAEAVRFSLLNNEPRITIFDVRVEFPNEAEGLVEIHIDYAFNQTNTRHNYVFPFHVNEGTNLGLTQ
ncbi:MAG: phage tail protein [Crocinitomix sp.]|nr:phage tail protein [Crocinitomix sp.]